ncbi:MAG: hypothetical protein Q4B85_01545 [Lachnospiraceae bacterium]|nr:hypothetical protein [Lachnospiraceae bacterium]
MLQYSASENMLVDFVKREHQGNFDLHIPMGQCAYLQFSDGREGFYESGDHRIRMDRPSLLFRRAETVSMYLFNLSDHIELHLHDTVQVMEQMLKKVDPELRLYAPVDVRVDLELTVRIEDREKLLKLLFDRQNREQTQSLDKEWISEYLERRMHYLLEESVNSFKQKSGTGIFNLSSLSDEVEGALIGEICDLLESLSLELVAARISQIMPTRAGILQFQERESESLAWYNQVQMDRFSRRKSSQVKKVARLGHKTT